MSVYTLYHVSPMENECSIVEYGLDPVFAQGKQALLWLAEKKAVSWALVHVSKLHKLPADELMIWRVVVDTLEIRRTNMPCIYTCNHKLPPYSPLSALQFFEPSPSNLWFPMEQSNGR